MVCPKCGSKYVRFISYYGLGKGYHWKCYDCGDVFYAPFIETVRKIREGK